ncbi:Myb-like_DNA-binding domain-containing protein [Hexamita inflata]|uniref:Myb-like DNA-binding domain-containing protein n=1 Tax=Hexamita inflata TaxID=28002 RepID=A0AA86Q8Y2_9EUKA|nr:Myb-like DNA-binding domain-containing protein [Hexamita inflata]
MPIQKWTETDISQLLKAIEVSKKNKRVDWSLVAFQIPGRTSVQCKSQYTARLHYKSVDKVNMVWSYNACLQLSAYCYIYNQDWQFISTSIYENKVTSEALKKQYFHVSLTVQQNMARHAQLLIENGSTQTRSLDKKSLYLYLLVQGLSFRLREMAVKIAAQISPDVQYTKVLLPKIYDHVPMLAQEIYTETADQTVFIPFYRFLEKLFRVEELIPIVENMIQNSNQFLVMDLCHEYDTNRTNIHKIFLQ